MLNFLFINDILMPEREGIAMTIGEIIRERRIELEISQDELAKKVGYTNRSSIARIESGEIDLPYSKIVAIASALSVDPVIFFSEDEYQKQRVAGAIFDKLAPAQKDAVIQFVQSMSTVENG